MITNLSQESFLQSSDDRIGHLLQYYYGDEIKDAMTTDDNVASLQEAIDLFKIQKDTEFPTENNKETLFLTKRYVLPVGVDENFLWKMHGSKKIYEEGGIFEKILELNPEVKNIVIEDESDKYVLMGGIASRFPLGDIKFCIESGLMGLSNMTKLKKTIVNSSIWKYCCNQELYKDIVAGDINNLKIHLSSDDYDLISGFSSFEDYQKFMDKSDYSGPHIEAPHVFSFYFYRDNVDITQYPRFAYQYLVRFIEKEFLTPINDDYKKESGVFGYIISPKNLEAFLIQNNITLQ